MRPGSMSLPGGTRGLARLRCVGLAAAFRVAPGRFVIGVIVAQGVLWTLAPTLGFQTPPLDVVENISWRRALAWWYYKHPPLQVWTVWAMLHLSGGVLWPLYLLSKIAIAMTYWAIWVAGCDLADRRAAAWAVLLSSLVYYFNLPTPEFNANVIQILIWAWAGVAFERALRGRRRWWVLLGVLMAAAFYAKYSAVVLALALTVLLLLWPEGRRQLATAGPWLAVAVAVALLIPHGRWLIDSDWAPLRYAAARVAASASQGGASLGRFVAAQLADHGARRFDVEFIEFGHDIFGHQQCCRGQQRDGFVGGGAVSRVDDGARQRTARKRAGVMQNDLRIAAVGAAGQQQDIGCQSGDLREIRRGQTIGEGADEFGAGAERGLARRFSGEFAHETDGHHAQAAGRTA